MNKLKLMQQIQFELASKGIASDILIFDDLSYVIDVFTDKGQVNLASANSWNTEEQELQQWLDVLVYGPQKAVDMNLSYEG